MNWRTPSYHFSVQDIVVGLFNADSEQAKALELSAINKIELHADGRAWNAILWLLVNTLKENDGTPSFSGGQLGEMKELLPIVFH